MSAFPEPAPDFRISEGTLLAAGPELLDPNFMHRVVLLCRHTEDGAYGLVVNRPSDVTTREVFASHPVLGADDAPAFPIFIGGPVGLDTLQVLHSLPEQISGGIEVAGGVFVGGELEDVAGYVTAGDGAARARLRLVLGYSGWGAGQLEAELAEGVWLPAAPDPAHVFVGDGEALWRRVLRSIGGPVEGLWEQPPDPEWN